MTPRQRRVLVIALIVHVIVMTLTWRDLRKRPDEAVRGKKRVWQVASAMNTSGSVAYWLLGRKSVGRQ
jgi:Na+/melibiose symporter-like transporter